MASLSQLSFLAAQLDGTLGSLEAMRDSHWALSQLSSVAMQLQPRHFRGENLPATVRRPLDH